MCAITLENKHRGTWGVWRHLLAFLGWQHRVALQHFHVEKHYLARESLLWVTLLPFKQWEVRTVTKLKTCFIKTGHCSTSWRGGKKRDSRETIGNENWTFEQNNGWSLSSGTNKGCKSFFPYVFARQKWEERIVCLFICLRAPRAQRSYCKCLPKAQVHPTGNFMLPCEIQTSMWKCLFPSIVYLGSLGEWGTIPVMSPWYGLKAR